ncbi:MAG: BREX system ATP-binding domain-containing protein [Candidatus Rhabdochlamydia sp.]
MDRLSLRRAIERLRDGLFDPVAVNQLTIEKDRIENGFSKTLAGKSDYLCICGSYGQGKSHTLAYLNQLALSQGYATSVVKLDLREVAFHQFSTVYRSIMERLSLPDGLKFTNAWKNYADKDSLEFLDNMPHRFKMILTAMLCKTKRLTPKKSSLKKHPTQSKEYGYWLDKALMGYDIPTAHLKNICKHREVKGYQEHSLICRGNDSYFQMIQSLGRVLQEMGYKGLLLFFDEAESIAHGRLSHRAKSYHLLDRFFQTKGSVFPVFAFTDDFFDKAHYELYDDNKEIFPKNYKESWQDLNILRLSDFSSHGWESLLNRLMQLYSQAYQIDLPLQIMPDLQALLGKLEAQETRLKLKALVHKLDIETQKSLLDI